MIFVLRKLVRQIKKKMLHLIIAALGLSFIGSYNLFDLSSDNLSSLEYSSNPYTYVNENVPYFDEAFLSRESTFEVYEELDSLGRAQGAYGILGLDTMPSTNEERQELNSNPSGLLDANGYSNNNQYDFIDNEGWIYNRCHLIGYALSSENDNIQNLITGTRFLNVEGMLDFEILVANYIRETENRVAYRVTPIYEGNELICRGVLMEAYSIEDNGEGICFCVYCYNVQPNVFIDYLTGENYEI